MNNTQPCLPEVRDRERTAGLAHHSTQSQKAVHADSPWKHACSDFTPPRTVSPCKEAMLPDLYHQPSWHLLSTRQGGSQDRKILCFKPRRKWLHYLAGTLFPH